MKKNNLNIQVHGNNKVEEQFPTAGVCCYIYMYLIYTYFPSKSKH